jgi:membrane protein YdbS with pleckstrin-like domain
MIWRAEMSVVNRPEVSRLLTWFYVAMTVLVVALGLPVAYFYLQAPRTEGIIGLVVIVAVGIIMVSLVDSIYRTNYALTQKELVIKASTFMGGRRGSLWKR